MRGTIRNADGYLTKRGQRLDKEVAALAAKLAEQTPSADLSELEVLINRAAAYQITLVRLKRQNHIK